MQLYKQKKEQQVELIDRILSDENIEAAIRAVQRNQGAPGIDKMPVGMLKSYFAERGEEIRKQIREKKYQPQPVRRVYIPKANGKMRPLGIPTVVDRVIQQAIAQVVSRGYERYFSEYSHGFRPNRSCHTAMEKVLEYLNEGYDWVIDLDIEKYFDTVNHDKLISILRERINDATTLHLIRSYLRAGVMEDGLVSATEEGVPQGGPLSPILSNVYLDKFDKELEARGLKFIRYADDCNIFVRSEMAADRVMASASSWLERKLRLKVSATKTKVVRPTGSTFLGFTFWKSKDGWMARPADINYFRIGSMKTWLKNDFSPWLRHKVRVVILKQWKKPKTVYKNLMKLNVAFGCNMTDEDIYKVAYSRLGLYRRCGMHVVNYLLSQKVLSLPNKKENRPGLVDPLAYYLRNT